MAANTVGSKVDWSSFPTNKDTGGSGYYTKPENRIKYLPLKPGETARFRPVGECKKFKQIMIKLTDENTGKDEFRSCYVSSTNPDEMAECERIVSEHLDKQIRATDKYVVRVIDRADGQLKVLTFFVKLFSEFAQQSMVQKHKNISVGDWEVTANKTKDGKYTYGIKFLGETKLTDAENTMLKSQTEAYKFSNVCREIPHEKIINSLFNRKTKQGFNKVTKAQFEKKTVEVSDDEVNGSNWSTNTTDDESDNIGF